MMPLIPWSDGSHKYLHVDVHRLSSYVSTMEDFIAQKLLARLDWLHGGSRKPFGILVESKVVVVVDSSYSVLEHVLGVQEHLRMLMREQLAHAKGFNLLRLGIIT